MKARFLCSLLPLLLVAAAPRRALSAEDEPPELTQVRELYKKDVEFATRPIRDRYLSKLETVKRGLASRGDVRGAVVVQDEIDLMKAANLEATDLAKFAGTWKIAYANGNNNRFVIRPDGWVTWAEENGVALNPPKKGRMVGGKAGFSLVFDQDSVDRLWYLSISGSNIAVQLFQPRGSYPNGEPAVRGTGTSVAPKR